MRRRDFISILGGASVAWPLAARAQQSAMPVIGLLAALAEEPLRGQIAAFRGSLRQSGFIEGQNVGIEYRYAAGQYDRLPAMAADFVGRKVSVIVALAPAAAVAAKAATATIPVVFVLGTDPVRLGLVESLNRPGGNVTGVYFLTNALGGKRLQLIRDLVPAAGTMGLLVNPNAPTAELDRQETAEAATKAGQKLRVLHAGSEQEFEAAFSTLRSEGGIALIINADALFTSGREALVRLAAKYAMPTIFHVRDAVLAGGLMSYGTSITDAVRIAGTYAANILRSAKPSELPVQQSVKFELVINLKTAMTLGLTVPPTLLALADEVIE
jgi:putative ABC transport system substrate-binding protein